MWENVALYMRQFSSPFKIDCSYQPLLHGAMGWPPTPYRVHNLQGLLSLKLITTKLCTNTGPVLKDM